MPRAPRLQFPGAIYHLVTRGDGRRALFHDTGHYERFTQGLAEEVERSGWEVFAYCWMPNHVHALVRTPEPNLAAGMQHWLSGYANWYAKRNRRTGHLYQGRYKSYLVEDSSYFWSLSRYIHLNPCRGKAPLVARPEAWAHSSYIGYARKSQRQDFVQYDTLLSAWQGECGGKQPEAAYRRYVLEGLTGVPDNPLRSALQEWVIGSSEFLARMVALAESEENSTTHRIRRRMNVVTVRQIFDAVAAAHGVHPEEYVGFRSAPAGREMAALLARRHTTATLAELSHEFGLQHPDSASNLVRRAKQQEEQSKPFRQVMKQIERKLVMKTENQA